MLHIAGIDIGSVALSLVLVDDKGTVVHSSYQFHKGMVRETLQSMFNNIDIRRIGGIAMTLSGPDLLYNTPRYDAQICMIAAVRHYHREVGSILYVGGENFGLITFNKEGDYESFKSNTSCAAGTGSFLDQQVQRLNLKSIDVLSTIAFCNKDNAPRIATRCSVFAKTDLTHAQQEGFSIGQISDGLCEGLAKNVIDTLMPDHHIQVPLILAGGVSMNQAVVKHFRTLLKTEPVIGEYSELYGAIGAALLYLEETAPRQLPLQSWDELFIHEEKEKHYGHPALRLVLSTYPECLSVEKYIYTPGSNFAGIEVDIYEQLNKTEEVYLGIDIGSTSTKAVLINDKNEVLVSLYTLTSGQPIRSVQTLFEAIEDIAARCGCTILVNGVGTTGSGRKFVGRIINADLIIDEITAHARAAYELDNEADTIIEIGGQDAKFTTMTNGMVTSSIMNNVCAAGTGSFIEEQAQKLGVPLAATSDRAINTPAPVSSNRCTVFMERDINNYLTRGYTVNEVLASVLHSVCENYLAKVAIEAKIGARVCFQGATARNRALVAAFEDRLKKPIFVSQFCHVTGALGCALMLAEKRLKGTSFRGLLCHKESIPVENEMCDLCHNNCKITKVTVGGETVAFGFMCGRDYDTKQYVGPAKKQYELIGERNKVFKVFSRPTSTPKPMVMGIPNALYLSEEMPLWQKFFDTLGIRTLTGEHLRTPADSGKRIAGAEFCTPMNAFFGHVQYLADKCDYLFLPVYLEAKEQDCGAFRYYCYYTQFAVSIAGGITSLNLKDRAIMPIIDRGSFHSKIELFKLLKPILNCSYWEIYNAYETALSFYNESNDKLRNIYVREMQNIKDISVVFLGRPYTVLHNAMNKGIPDIFGNLNIKAFFQDMLPIQKEDMSEIDPLLKRLHWNYAAKILKAALVAAHTEGVYPVYITSFKCSPDSITIGYFKRIMDRYGKPYLLLELDEHDSSVGYETRIEASVRSFRNHYTYKNFRVKPARSLPLNSESTSQDKEQDSALSLLGSAQLQTG